MTESSRPAPADTDRRDVVLGAALATFARFGYRKTSMDQVARDAGISRPGLYFLFASKQALFRAAVTRSLEEDLAAAETALTGGAGSLQQRVVDGFDRWAGRYVGPLTRDVATVIEDNPDLLGPVVETAPRRFAELVTAAVATALDPGTATRVAQTLLSVSVGIKHQVDDREAYLDRLRVAVELLLPGESTTSGDAHHARRS